MQHFTGCDVQRREQIDGAVAPVVVRHRAASARLERQRRLSPVERLDLRLLIEGEHHRPLGRIKVEPDEINQLGFEVRIVRQLERVDLPWPQPTRPPDSRHCVLADPVPGGHRPRGPTRTAVVGHRVQGVVHDRVHRGRRDLGGLRPRPGAITPIPATPSATNRSRHRVTVSGCEPSERAVERTDAPSANANNA